MNKLIVIFNCPSVHLLLHFCLLLSCQQNEQALGCKYWHVLSYHQLPVFVC